MMCQTTLAPAPPPRKTAKPIKLDLWVEWAARPDFVADAINLLAAVNNVCIEAACIGPDLLDDGRPAIAFAIHSGSDRDIDAFAAKAAELFNCRAVWITPPPDGCDGD